MARVCHRDIHQNALEGEKKSRQIECGANDRSNPGNICFGCESEYKNTCGDENAGHKTDFEANLGRDRSSCFNIERCDIILLIQAICRILQKDSR